MQHERFVSHQIDEKRWLQWSGEPEPDARNRALLYLLDDEDSSLARLKASGRVAARVVDLLDDPVAQVRNAALFALAHVHAA